MLVILTLPYFLLPLYWLVVAATKTNSQLFSTFGLWFDEINLWSNITHVFTAQGGIFWTWIGNTVLYAVVSAAGAAFGAAGLTVTAAPTITAFVGSTTVTRSVATCAAAAAGAASASSIPISFLVT